ncbi:MAG: nuclear transport factor 2 family protein [Leptolyngbyaceae cyanobacterium]
MNPHSASPIAELEERLRQAMLTSDVAELDALIAPELLFTNYLGQRITKQQDLEMHRSQVLKLTALTPSDQHIQQHDRFAVVSVQMHLLGSYDGTPIDQHMRFTRVWAISSADVWQIVAGHASVVAA